MIFWTNHLMIVKHEREVRERGIMVDIRSDKTLLLQKAAAQGKISNHSRRWGENGLLDDVPPRKLLIEHTACGFKVGLEAGNAKKTLYIRGI